MDTAMQLTVSLGAITNDTIIGDPLYSASLTKINGGPDNLCYEVRGSDNQHYNLISDECVSVNALYQAMDIPEFGNIMGTIGVRAETNDGRCYNIRVEREGCRALASDGVAEPVEIDPTFATGGISVRRYPNRVRISAPNCDQVTLVMWVRCVTRRGQDMLDFTVSRGTNLRPTSHGLLGKIILTLMYVYTNPPLSIFRVLTIRVPLQRSISK